jgi:hypothetical protein
LKSTSVAYEITSVADAGNAKSRLLGRHTIGRVIEKPTRHLSDLIVPSPIATLKRVPMVLIRERPSLAPDPSRLISPLVSSGARVQRRFDALPKAGRVVPIGTRVVGAGEEGARLEAFALADREAIIVGQEQTRRHCDRLRQDRSDGEQEHSASLRGGRKSDH